MDGWARMAKRQTSFSLLASEGGGEEEEELELTTKELEGAHRNWKHKAQSSDLRVEIEVEEEGNDFCLTNHTQITNKKTTTTTTTTICRIHLLSSLTLALPRAGARFTWAPLTSGEGDNRDEPLYCIVCGSHSIVSLASFQNLTPIAFSLFDSNFYWPENSNASRLFCEAWLLTTTLVPHSFRIFSRPQLIYVQSIRRQPSVFLLPLPLQTLYDDSIRTRFVLFVARRQS